MASSIIHIAISKKVNKYLKRNESKLFIGTIAPDISKLLNQTKERSHFLTEDNDIPNLDLFLSKYEEFLEDDFVMGYYLHLLEDYFWFKYFIPEIIDEDKSLVKNLKGEVVRLDKNQIIEYVYSDYTNLNISLIDYYNLDLKIFYNELPMFNNIIKEIPMDKLEIVVDKMGVIIENSKESKEYLFNMENVINFIDLSTTLILNHLELLNLI